MDVITRTVQRVSWVKVHMTAALWLYTPGNVFSIVWWIQDGSFWQLLHIRALYLFMIVGVWGLLYLMSSNNKSSLKFGEIHWFAFLLKLKRINMILMYLQKVWDWEKKHLRAQIITLKGDDTAFECTESSGPCSPEWMVCDGHTCPLCILYKLPIQSWLRKINNY